MEKSPLPEETVNNPALKGGESSTSDFQRPAIHKSITEIDLTHETLKGAGETLSKLVQDGYILHGSQNSKIEELESRLAQFGNTGEKQEAVYASDNPYISIARAAAGENLVLWNAGIFFGVSEIRTMPTEVYVYAIPKKNFSGIPGDVSEYYNKENVKPTHSIKLNPEIITGSFRTLEELSNLGVLYENGQLDLQKLAEQNLRETDVELTMLFVNHLLNMQLRIQKDTGRSITGYTSSADPEGDMFIRASTAIRRLAPVFNNAAAIASADQIKLWQLVQNKYYKISYEVMDNYELGMFDVENTIARPMEKAGIKTLW